MTFFVVKSRSLYDIHDPIGIKFLTRLRVGLSHLRAHKYAHNFQDTPNPNCTCNLNESETVEHFFLFCPNYCSPRKQFFNFSSDHISLVSFVNAKNVCDLLLYGDKNLNWNTNREIIKATIGFILMSKRFDIPLIEN